MKLGSQLWMMVQVSMVGLIVSSCALTNVSAAWDSSPIPQTSDRDRRYLVRVNRVVSGQTIEVQSTSKDSSLNQMVRLIGIQAPDRDQKPWGPEAQTYLESLLLGQTVQLSFGPELLDESTELLDENTLASIAEQSIDAYGRQWAYVWLDSQLVNQQLIADGMVLVEERSPHLHYVHQFHHAQHRARVLGLGIWNPDNPMRQTPSEFRQQQE